MTASSVREAGNAAYRALCELEDALDAQTGPLNEAARNELGLLQRRWEHDTEPKIARAWRRGA